MKEQANRAPRPIARIQQNILAVSERKLLTWLCSQMPPWVTPDILTTTGVVGAFAIFVGYAASGFHIAWLWLAIAGYVVQWFGDSLDGSLARYRKIERPRFGYFIDHSCDGITTLLILAGIGLSPFVRLDVALVALAGYLLLSIHAYLSVQALGELKLSYLAAGPTELRFVLIGMTVAMMAVGSNPAPVGTSWFDVFVGSVAALFIVLFAIQTLTIARRLARTAG
ncbi:MAG: CDP-alcohol phosphatidyltransferase family protein [Sphingomonas sp.]